MFSFFKWKIGESYEYKIVQAYFCIHFRKWNINRVIHSLGCALIVQDKFFCAGYLVSYTTDPTLSDSDWVVEGVLGDRVTTILRELSPDTTYYFRIQVSWFNCPVYSRLYSQIYNYACVV